MRAAPVENGEDSCAPFECSGELRLLLAALPKAHSMTASWSMSEQLRFYSEHSLPQFEVPNLLSTITNTTHRIQARIYRCDCHRHNSLPSS